MNTVLREDLKPLGITDRNNPLKNFQNKENAFLNKVKGFKTNFNELIKKEIPFSGMVKNILFLGRLSGFFHSSEE